MKNTVNGVNGVDAADVLGGVDVQTTPSTPGAAARQYSGEKREYTPRGTTYWCKRVVLKDGQPTGRGRPSFEGIGARTVVYIPKDAEYDAKIFGTGVKFNSHNHRFPFKRIAKDSVSWTFDDGIEPTAPKTKPAKAVKNGKGGKTVAVANVVKATKASKTALGNAVKDIKAKAVKAFKAKVVRAVQHMPVEPAHNNASHGHSSHAHAATPDNAPAPEMASV